MYAGIPSSVISGNRASNVRRGTDNQPARNTARSLRANNVVSPIRVEPHAREDKAT